MTMREKIVSMKDDDIKAGVEEAKELEAENAPCTITAFLFSKMLAVSLTQRIAAECCLYKRKKHGSGLLLSGCAKRIFPQPLCHRQCTRRSNPSTRYHTPPGHCDCSGGGRLLVW